MPQNHPIVDTLFKIFGLLFTIAFFLFIPALGHIIWPYYMIVANFLSLTKHQLVITIIMSTHMFTSAILYALYYLIYHIEHPFFENYKINKNLWPWKEDISKWKLLV